MKTSKLTIISRSLLLLAMTSFLTFSLLSQRKLTWRGTYTNNGGQLANYVDQFGNPFALGPTTIQASDTIYFTEGNIIASQHANILFPVGTICAKMVVTNNSTGTPYNLTFQSGINGSTVLGTTIDGNLEVTGGLSHIIKGIVTPNEQNLSNVSLRVNGNIDIPNSLARLRLLHLTCAGAIGSSNFVNIDSLTFESGYLNFDVSEAKTNSGTFYSLPHYLYLLNVKILFNNGSINSNGHNIRTDFADPIYYSDDYRRASIFFNLKSTGSNGVKGTINLSNSKISVKGNLYVVGYESGTVSYNLTGTTFEIFSASIITEQQSASAFSPNSQRLYWSGIKKISFLSDGLDGNDSHLQDFGFNFGVISANEIFIDRADFEFRGSGGDRAPSNQSYIFADTLRLSANVNRVGFSQIAPPYRFNTIVSLAPAVCSTSLLFENLPGFSSGRGRIKLGSTVTLTHLSIRSMEVTAPALVAGYDLGNNATPNLSYSPPASKIFYWVGGPANWHEPEHWSIGSAVATYPTSLNTNPGGCLPTIIDSVVFGVSSGLTGGSVQIAPNQIAYCKGMLWDNAGAVSFNGFQLFISGNFKNTSGVTTIGVPFHFVLGGNRTIQSGGTTFSGFWNFGHTGEYKLLDNLAGGVWSHYSGTVNFNTNTVNISRYNHPYDAYWSLVPVNTFKARELIITSSQLNVSSANAWDVWADLFTLQAQFSTINFNNSTANITFNVNKTASLSALTTHNYWDINVVNNPFFLTTFNSSIHLTFNDMSFTGNTRFTDGTLNRTWLAHNMTFTKSYTYDFDGLDRLNLTGNWIVTPPSCGGMTFFTSNLDSVFTINATTAQTVSECMFTRINASPGAPFTVTNGVDNGANLNVTFSSSGGQTFYWRGGNPLNAGTSQRINWDNGENWAINDPLDFNPSILSNTGKCIPGISDSVVFDINSFAITGGSNEVKINTTAYCKDIVWTPGSVTPVIPVFNFNTNKRLDVYRSLQFMNGMTFSNGSLPIHFLAGTGVNATIDFGGILPTTGTGTFISTNGDIYIDGAGTFDMRSDIPFRFFTHQNGTLNTNGYTLAGFQFGSYSSTLSGISGSLRNIDFSTSTIRLIGGQRIFQMDYKDLTGLSASLSTIESNSPSGAGEFRHIRIEEFSIVHKYGHVKNFLKSFSYRGPTGPVNYLGTHTGDLRNVANGSRPFIKVRKLDYAASSTTETYGNFDIDTLILGRINSFYLNATTNINDTVITNGVPCSPTVIRGGIEYQHQFSGVVAVTGVSKFNSPTCDLFLGNVSMSGAEADISACGGSYSYKYSGIDGLNNLNWIFDPVSIAVPTSDTIVLTCSDLPYTLTLSSNYGSASTSVTWSTTETTDSILVSSAGTYYVDVNFGGGCIMSDTFKLVVQDVTAPLISCLSDTTVGSGPNCELVVPDFTSSSGITITDDCSVLPSGITVTQTPTPGTILSIGDTTVWIFAEDESGNIDSCSFVLVVTDQEAPSFVSCITDSTIFTDVLICGAQLADYTNDLGLTILDNCSSISLGSIIVTQNPSPGSIVSIGTTDIWIIATDASGNSDSCSFELTIVDNQAPTINNCIVDTSLIANNNNCQLILPDFTNDPMLNITDNCGNTTNATITVSQSPIAGSILDIGVHTISIYASDENGNIDSCSFELTVLENLNPTILSCGVDTTINLSGLSCQTSLPDFTASPDLILNTGCLDSSDSNLTITQFPSAGTIIGNGTTTVSIYLSYSGNLFDSCSFIVTVNANLPAIVLNSIEESYCTGEDVSLSVNNPDASFNYSWWFNNSQVASGPTYTITSTGLENSGVYSVAATNNAVCSLADATITLNLISCDIIIYDIISPNNDGKNETFYIENLEGFPNTEVDIFNRWGTLVYHNDDYKNDWNGISQSQYNTGNGNLPEGTYFYLLKLGGDASGASYQKIYKGYLYLKRD